MWVSYDNLWLFYAGSIGLILFLYAVKFAALRYLRTNAAPFLVFAAATALCVPLTWALSPDWGNPDAFPIHNIVGMPVATLAVPCASFMIDLRQRPAVRKTGWLWRLPLELFIAAPAWFVFWAFFELLVLGWVWI